MKDSTVLIIMLIIVAYFLVGLDWNFIFGAR